MNEQPVVETISLFQMISWSGFFGVSATIISLLILIATPILFATVKRKRQFTLWLMTQTIIGNLIIALIVFTYGILKTGMTMGGFWYKPKSVGMLIAKAIDLLPACTTLIFISFALFALRFFFVAGAKYKEN